jgi:molybdate transport system substrate-binding protein
MKIISKFALLLTIPLLSAPEAKAADIHLLCSQGISTVVEALAPNFERATGNHLVITFAATSALKKQIIDGTSFDVVIVAAPVIDELSEQGKLVKGSRKDIARTGIGVAFKTGAAKPDISSTEAFKKTMLNAQSVAYTGEGVSGQYFAGLLQRLGIADAMKPKAHILPSGRAGELVAKGEAQYAVQQISELLPVEGTQLAGPLPADLQNYTMFSAGLSSGAGNVDGAKSLVAFLSNPSGFAVIKTKGMEPG